MLNDFRALRSARAGGAAGTGSCITCSVDMGLPHGPGRFVMGIDLGAHLLVCEHQQHRFAQLVLVEHAVQLIAGLPDSVAVIAVHDEDEPLGVLEVVPPQGPDFVLASHIPDCEADVLVLHCLHIEANGHQGQSEGVVRTKGAQASQRALPAASRPTISIRISFLLKSLAKSRLKGSAHASGPCEAEEVCIIIHAKQQQLSPAK
eukprot:jgi/Astpho2/4315/Aster-x1212